MTQTVEQYEAAMTSGIRLFMKQGFSNVSIDDIVTVTGLNRYSIYSAFGTKADFFRTCVRRYCATAVDSLDRLVGNPDLSPIEAARANLYAAAEEMCEIGAGCLICENMKEMNEAAPELIEHCRKYYDTKEKILRGFFFRAKEARAIPDGIDPDEAAAAFMIFKFGLSNEVKLSGDVGKLKRKIDAFLSAMFR